MVVIVGLRFRVYRVNITGLRGGLYGRNDYGV